MSKQILNKDMKLSRQARFMLLVLADVAKGKKKVSISNKEIRELTKYNAIDSVINATKELEEQGYIEIIRQKRERQRDWMPNTYILHLDGRGSNNEQDIGECQEESRGRSAI